ncbi:MAG: antitoxin VapB family protein [Euryarchaeota archaeon]|nr:antitoxin VapB family protein [Euryarchaeota archaeon]
MTRQISVADDVYDLLRALKRPAESFSEAIRRLGETARKNAILELAGSWKISDEEAKRITDDIYANRKASRFRKVEL